MADNDDYMQAKTYGNVIAELMWDRLQEGMNANRRFRIRGMAGGNNMRYDTTKVVWDTAIRIYFTRESDGGWVYNEITANPTTGITCGDNDLLYVTLNDTSGTTLTVDTADYTAMPTDDMGRIVVLGAVYGTEYYHMTALGLERGISIDASNHTVVEGQLQVSGTTKADGKFYAGTTDPTLTTRLNYDGYLYPTRCYNAVYNDYADYWGILPAGEEVMPNKVYITLDGKIVTRAFKRADPRAIGICSDNYGFAVGKAVGKVPVSVAGFVRAWVDKPDQYKPGTRLVNNKDGNLTKARFWERYKAIAMFMGQVEGDLRCWVKVI